MSKITLRLVAVTAMTLLALAPFSASAVAQTPGLTTNPAWEPENPDAGTGSLAESEADVIARRLFAALLSREPSALEMEQAADQVGAGQVDSLVRTVLGSSEYRNLRSTKTANGLLDQYFAGLLDRAPDAGAYRIFTGELSRGNDAAVVRAILDSTEFDDLVAGVSLKATEVERRCMQAVEQRISGDLGQQMRLRFLEISTSRGTFMSEEIRGAARLSDERGVEFACVAERLRGSIVDVAYQLEEPAAPEVVSTTIVRCESESFRRRECAVEAGAEVTFVRQLSRARCTEDVSWGRTDRAIWVDRGCSADFQVVSTGARELRATVQGRGFLQQEGSEGLWLSSLEISCELDGNAALRLTGKETVPLEGTCYRLNDERIELDLASRAGSWHSGAAGSVILDGTAVRHLSVAGRGRFGQPFSIDFSAVQPAEPRGLQQTGEGELQLGDGRRVDVGSMAIEPSGDGRVELVFDGQTRFALRGSWFETWSGGRELVIDGGLNDSSIRGAGSVTWGPGGAVSIQIIGAAPSVGGTFRLTFEGSVESE